MSQAARSVLIATACFFAAALAGVPEAWAQVELPHVFVAGDRARAAQVNANFAELETEVEALQARVDELETENADFEARIRQLEGAIRPLEEIAQVLSVSRLAVNGVPGPNLVVEGANLHVRSGSGTTDDGGTPTGLGNVIIGYNEVATDQQAGDRDGAHNLVIGSGHIFTSTAGVVAGEDNEIGAPFASVLAGQNNSASGEAAVVSGGAFNQANGEASAVSGGVSNFAQGLRASVCGGAQNTASGVAASISGGSGGSASGFAASISGGQSNIATGDQSAVSGGQSNSVFGDKTVVGGGFNRTDNEDFSWTACDLTCS